MAGWLKHSVSFSVILLLEFYFLTAPLNGAQMYLSGAGATFPLPYYSAIFEIYRAQLGTRIDYKGIGSGGGIRKLLAGDTDFAGTDAFLTDAEMREASSPILHVPTCLGGVAVTYNLSGNAKLRFDPQIISDIFLGKITMWNDPRIVAVNPNARLPDSPIHVFHRSDESGTTFIFSEYLSKISPQWKERVGYGKSVKWPVGQGARTNAGVAGLIRQTPNSVGYVELIYALGNSMTVAAMRNRSGRYVEPTTKSIGLAVTDSIPDDTHISLTILIMEDDDDLRALVSEILTNAGYLIHAARDGEEGLALFKEKLHSIEMVITDVIMPRLGGLEVYREIRALKPGIVVVFVTGYGPVSLGLVDDQSIAFVQKPFSIPMLSRKIRQLLDRILDAPASQLAV